MISRRIPADSAPNPWTLRLASRRASSAALLDLTDQNPTRVGLASLGDAERDAVARAASMPYAPDPLGLPAAREAVAAYYASRGLAVDPGDILLTSGTSEAYAHVFCATCNPGDRVLVPAPGYPLIGPLASLEGVDAVPLPLRAGAGWRLDLEALRGAIDARTRAIVAIQPNHPTGCCLDAAERAAVTRHCAADSCALISDEVFGDFLCAASEGTPGAEPSLLANPGALTFVFHGLSKLCGMPQLKLGWIALAGPEPERRRAREALEWVADAFLSVSGPVQHALPVLLEARHAFRRRTLDRVLANRAALRHVLAGTGAELLDAEGGWVAMVRLPRGRSADERALALLDRDVMVHPGHFYDVDDDRHLVVSLLPEPSVFSRGAARLADAVGRD